VSGFTQDHVKFNEVEDVMMHYQLTSLNSLVQAIRSAELFKHQVVFCLDLPSNRFVEDHQSTKNGFDIKKLQNIDEDSGW
jgi:hypothetical protein